ncbi:unnamed protein product, partial [Amoebophrya sp. A25]|eukprot:GSA25T00004181001.1
MFQLAKHHPRMVCVASDRLLETKHFAYHAASCGPVLRFFPHFARTDPCFVRMCLQHASFEEQYDFPRVKRSGVLPVHLEMRCEEARAEPISAEEVDACLSSRCSVEKKSSLQTPNYVLVEQLEKELKQSISLASEASENRTPDTTSRGTDAVCSSSSFPLDHLEIELDWDRLKKPGCYLTVDVLRDNVIEGTVFEPAKLTSPPGGMISTSFSMDIPLLFRDPEVASGSVHDIEWRCARNFA